VKGDTESARLRSKDEAEIRLPIARMFPRTDGQAKVVVIIILAVILAALAYGLVRGLGLTDLFGE
jgi:hypothetical protein